MNKTPLRRGFVVFGWEIVGLGMVRAGDYGSATYRPIEPESPINPGFLPPYAV